MISTVYFLEEVGGGPDLLKALATTSKLSVFRSLTTEDRYVLFSFSADAKRYSIQLDHRKSTLPFPSCEVMIILLYRRYVL